MQAASALPLESELQGWKTCRSFGRRHGAGDSAHWPHAAFAARGPTPARSRAQGQHHITFL